MNIKTIRKRTKAIIGKSRILKSLIISLLAFSISYGLYYVFLDKLTYLGVDTSNLSYLKEYYKQRNQLDTIYDKGKAEEKILIIPIKDSTTNETIADLIDTLRVYEAKVIGIDCIFQQSPNNNESCNIRLKEAIKRNSDKIVLAQAYNNNKQIIKNIFDGDSMLCFGLVNSYGFDSIPYKRSLKNKELDYFAYQVALKYNPNIKNKVDLEHSVINYSNIRIRYMGISNIRKAPIDIKKSYIGNKVVLIGAYDDISDTHSTPFIIEGNEMVSGIKLHAYAIYSLITPDFVLSRLAIGSVRNIFGFFVLCFLYSLVYVLLTDKRSRFIKKYESIFNILRPILLLLLVNILLYVCYYITTNHNIIPNVVPLLLSVFLINTFNDFLTQYINSEKYEKV